ncbi:MAG: hypothetical protein L3V56_03765 [Candidatus Magnetoovum sp. WYHC-5]|nr:hypothetical protein [Candidatus Magnetoovum sp. WYHC-5]
MMNVYQTKVKEKRKSLRVNSSDEDSYFIIEGKRYRVLDMSTDAIRFDVDESAFVSSEYRIEFTGGELFDFKGNILRADDKSIVINLSKDVPDELIKKIANDVQGLSQYHDVCMSEKRKAVRLKYPQNLKPQLHMINRAFKIVDISSIAAKVEVGGSIVALAGLLVFPDKDQYYIEGNLIRLMGNEAVLIFSNDGIPAKKIAREAVKNLDDYLF